MQISYIMLHINVTQFMGLLTFCFSDYCGFGLQSFGGSKTPTLQWGE